jgi:photosystem II stability/assembly factor-like uncharacterized protein
MKHFIKLAIVSLFAISLSACSIPGFSSNKLTADAAVYLSTDIGTNWQASRTISTKQGLKDFSDASVVSVAVDPQDNKAIYMATEQYGLLYSYDGGLSWQQTLTDTGKVTAVIVDPKNTCVIYATILNRLYKTVDCSRHWTYQLIEAKTRPNDQITSVQINPIEPQKLYAGSSGGALFSSPDGGMSWSVVNFFKSQVNKIIINPNNQEIIYVATQKDGLFRSADNGANWQELFSNDIKSSFPQIREYRDFKINTTARDGLIYAAKNVFFITEDGGQTWRNVTLLTPPKATNISSIAINPLNKDNLFVAISGVLYTSLDGGQTWSTKKINSNRQPKNLLLIGDRFEILFLGMFGIKK